MTASQVPFRLTRHHETQAAKDEEIMRTATSAGGNLPGIKSTKTKNEKY